MSFLDHPRRVALFFLKAIVKSPFGGTAFVARIAADVCPVDIFSFH
jgi:hypothetical protein